MATKVKVEKVEQRVRIDALEDLRVRVISEIEREMEVGSFGRTERVAAYHKVIDLIAAAKRAVVA